jgi:hypothetical protein
VAGFSHPGNDQTAAGSANFFDGRDKSGAKAVADCRRKRGQSFVFSFD